MAKNQLHIVSFDVPYPPDYGGAVDVFFKLKALFEAGIKITLHCFEYGRPRQAELNKYCEAVCYYPRQTGIKGISLIEPYIVHSRNSQALLDNLSANGDPILFEGVHTTYYLNHIALRDRTKAIRIHNIENDYYAQLASKEPKLLTRLFFHHESRLLKKYERRLKAADAFFALSATDHEYFKSLYPKAIHEYIPPFHPFNEVTSLIGSGTFALYHGNLSHPENREAAVYLMDHICPSLKTNLIIAGKNPGDDLKRKSAQLKNCQIIANPDQHQLNELMQNAQLHILPTFQRSGVKLKLLNALFSGRHVLVNPEMLHGTNLPNDCCHMANSSESFIQTANKLLQMPFTQAELEKRKKALSAFGNLTNAKKLASALSLL